MRPKEKQIFEALFRLKHMLEHLETLVILAEHESEYFREPIFSKDTPADKIFPVKKQRGRPPGKKK